MRRWRVDVRSAHAQVARVSWLRAAGPSSCPSRSVASAFLLAPVTILIAVGTAYCVGLRVNLSGSIPTGVYRLESGSVTRGSIVLACLPPKTAAFARARGYVPRGACGDGSAPVGKTVAAVAGDTVTVRPDAITVNGRVIPNSRALARDSDNRVLRAYPVGEYVVAPTDIWLISSFSGGSFDSRYFGPVPVGRVLARIRRISCADLRYSLERWRPNPRAARIDVVTRRSSGDECAHRAPS